MNVQNAGDRIIERIVASESPMVVFAIGVPGSGKSTLLDYVGRNLDTAPIDVDAVLKDVRAEGWHSGSFSEFEHRVHAGVANHLVEGGVALLDSTNSDPEKRVSDVSLYRSLGARTIAAVVLEADVEAAIERDSLRPASRRQGPGTIGFMANRLRAYPPNLHEGFDWIEQV
jgi:predicted kinase